MHVSEADQERRSKVLGASSLAASLAMAAVFKAEKAGTSGQALLEAAEASATSSRASAPVNADASSTSTSPRPPDYWD